MLIILGAVTQSIGNDETDEDQDVINCFTSSSSSIVTSHKSGLLKLWTHDGALHKTWKSIHKGPISKMSFDKSNRLATGGSDSGIRLWDMKYQACTHSLKGCQGVVSCLEFHLSKNVLFAASDDYKIRSWNLDSQDNDMREYIGHYSTVTSLNFDKNDTFVISTGRDKVVILWDIEKITAIKIVPVFESLESVVVLPDKFETLGIKCEKSLFVALGGENGRIKIWDLLKNKEVCSQNNSLIPKAKEEGGLSIVKLLFNNNSHKFCVVSVDHNILIHNLENFTCEKQFVGFSDEILDVCFVGENDDYLAVATNSNDLKIYNNQTMNCNLVQGHTDIILALTKSPIAHNIFLSSSKDNSIRVWQLQKIENTGLEVICVAVGSKHTGSVGSIAFSQTSSNFAVSVSQDTTLKIWEIPKTFTQSTQVLECLRTEIAHQKDINCVSVSPNDKIIATGSQDKTCKLWNENLELLGALRGHKRGIWCAKFSPVDQVIVTSSADCTVKLWSIVELNCLKTLEGHESSVLNVDFLSNGMQILTAGADGFLKVFSIKSSECNITLDQHEGRIWALAVKSDESTIISGGSDSYLIKWKDVTLEKRLEKTKIGEELAIQEQQLNNLVHNNELLKALKLSLRLDRPFQTLKIVEGIIKKGDTGLADIVTELKSDQKELLLKCANTWNTNSKHCQPAQLIINILLNELQSGNFKPIALPGLIETTLPYTERHFKRLTQLLQDLHFINYTINCMQPFAKKTE